MDQILYLQKGYPSWEYRYHCTDIFSIWSFFKFEYTQPIIFSTFQKQIHYVLFSLHSRIQRERGVTFPRKNERSVSFTRKKIGINISYVNYISRSYKIWVVLIFHVLSTYQEHTKFEYWLIFQWKISTDTHSSVHRLFIGVES